MSSSDLPEAGARLALDLSEWESNWASAIADAETLQSQIDDLGGSVDIEINIDDATLPFDDIPEEITTEATVTEDADTKSLVDGLTFLVLKEKIEWAIDIAGNVWDFFSKIENLVVSPFLDVEDAVARINAQTGGTGIEDLGQFIRDIQAADLGDSVSQIGQVVIAAKQLNAPIDEATRASLSFTKVFDNQDPVTVLTTLKSLSDQFGVSITTAGDALTVFFQNGGNKGGDALNTVNQYAQSWADMGLSFTEALSLVQSLMAGGVDTSGDAAKMIQTFDDQMTAAAADPASQQAKLLKMMGIDNPKDKGEAIGAETVEGFVAAFDNLPADQQDLVSGLFFGKGGKKFTSAIEGATTQGGMFADVVGAAEDAASAIDDSLRGAIDDFVLEINTSLTELLSSENIDLPGKIKQLKEGFQAAAEVLAGGGTIGEALEVGFKIEGADEFIANLERIFGNIGIILLQAVAAVQSMQGVDNKGTLATIAQMSQKQLAFDLQVANSDEVATLIDQAITRGVSVDNVGAALRTAVEEEIASGDFQDALNLTDAIVASAARNGSDAAATIQAWLQPLIDEANKGIEDAKPKVQQAWWDTFGPSKAFDPTMMEDNLKIGQASSAARGGEWWTQFGGQGGFQQSTIDQWKSMIPPDDVATSIGETKTAIEELDTSTQTTTDNVATNWNNLNVSVSGATAAVISNMDQTAAKGEEMDTRLATSLTENTVTSSFQSVADTASQAFPSVMAWFEQTSAAAASMDITISGHVQHLLNILHDLQFLSAQVATGVQAAIALGGQLPGQPIGAGAGGGGSTTYNNVNVTNNVPNGAAASSNGYAIANSLRLGG